MFKNRLVHLILPELHTYKSNSNSGTNSHKTTQSHLNKSVITGIISAVVAFIVVVIIPVIFFKYLYRKRRGNKASRSIDGSI